MPTYIKADQFFYSQGIRQGGYLELIDGKLASWCGLFRRMQKS